MSDGPESDPLKDLLLADLEHFGESLWRNEEVGEKRLNFFITLTTAVVAGLVALHTAEKTLDSDVLKRITNGALGGLFILGVITYLRMLQRNRVSDEYMRTLKYIRGKLLDRSKAGVEYDVPRRPRRGVWVWVRGGFAETMAAMNAVLLCTLLILNFGVAVWVIAVGLVILVSGWIVAAAERKRVP